MELSELIRTRRTVHNYKPEKVADALVQEALRLALWAPNHKLTFPWGFFMTGAATRKKLADLAVEIKNAKEPLSDVKKMAARDNILNPSHLILIGVKRSDARREHEDYATLACSVQIASMFLWEKGIGTKWSTGAYFTGEHTYEIAGVSPAEYRLEGALIIGVPQVIPRATERPVLNGFLHQLT